MSTRRVFPAVLASVFALLFFGLGNYLGARQTADSDVRLAELRAEVDLLAERPPEATGTSGTSHASAIAMMDDASRASLIADVKRQLQDEMGLLPLTLLRERRESFVELYSYDDRGSSSYGTAGYLGNGYFITVKHGVIALGQEGTSDPRKIVSVKLMYKGRPLAARVVDSGDAKVEVDSGDWAIVKVKETIDLPPLNVNLAYGVRLRRSDLPARQRLLEGHHPGDRLRRPAHQQQPRHLPDRRPSRRVGRRRAQSQRRARRHSDRPDAGRFPLLVHPAAAAGDVQEDPALE